MILSAILALVLTSNLYANPYEYDDFLRFEGDKLAAPRATAIMTEKGRAIGVITDKDTIFAWEVEGKTEVHYGKNKAGQVEQIITKEYEPSGARAKVSNIKLSTAGFSGTPSSVHFAELADYTNLVSIDDISSLKCRSDSQRAPLDLNVLIVKDRVVEASLDERDIAKSCQITNQSLDCKTKNIHVDLSRKEKLENSPLYDFFVILIGGNVDVKYAYKGRADGGFWGSDYNLYCF